MKPEVIKKFGPITVLDVVRKQENNSRKLELTIPEKIKYVLWTEAVATGDEGFCGKLSIEREQLSKEQINKLTVQIEPSTEVDEIAIKKFHKRIKDAMKRYEEHKHPMSHVPDTTDYSLNHINNFKRFYLDGLNGTSPERK